MAVTTVTQYVTTDGATFNNVDDANAHEATLDTMSRIQYFFQTNLPGPGPWTLDEIVTTSQNGYNAFLAAIQADIAAAQGGGA